jgi:hypothetical protein
MGIFSFDAETNGLWGQAFSIAALVYDESGAEIARFAGRCPIQGEINPWVLENVLPQMTGLDETHSSYEELLRDFAVFYLLYKQKNAVIAHVAVPVESQVLRDMHSQGFIGDWDGPFPLIDIVGMLTMANEDPTSVDSYCQKYGIHVSAEEFDGGTHNPLYDSAVAAQVYMHLLQSRDGTVS